MALLAAAPAVGSFVGLLADRAVLQHRVVFPGVATGRSRCDHCGAPLAPRDLAPLISFAVLGGRSRCCARPLRPFLPMVELAALGVAAWATVIADGAVALVSAGLGWALLALSLIDLRLRRLPDAITLPLLAMGLAVSALGLSGPFWLHALGAGLGYGFFAGAGALYFRLRGREGLGLGDAKLLGAGGAWVGAAGLPSALLVACLIGLAHVCVLRAAGDRPPWRAEIAFGPALSMGVWITWLHGPLVLQ